MCNSYTRSIEGIIISSFNNDLRSICLEESYQVNEALPVVEQLCDK